MTEAEAIATSDAPRTRASLLADLRALGLSSGDIVIAHCSMSALGWVSGDAQTVIEAILDAIGDNGTLVMTAHSGQLTDPAEWQAPPVPPDWVATIRETMPAYDQARTPTRALGRVPELFWTWPGVVRSGHPHTSFAALGLRAMAICENHALESPTGEQSPLARLYDLDARVLLVGVGFDRCTALHLAELRAHPNAPARSSGAPMMVDGVRRWITFSEPDVGDHYNFLIAGDALIALGAVRAGAVGSAQAIIGPIRAIVDGAVSTWNK